MSSSLASLWMYKTSKDFVAHQMKTQQRTMSKWIMFCLGISSCSTNGKLDALDVGKKKKHIFQVIMNFWLNFTNLLTATQVKRCSYNTGYVCTYCCSWNICKLSCLHSKQMNLTINSCCQAAITASMCECVHACQHQCSRLNSAASKAAEVWMWGAVNEDIAAL